MSKLLPKIMMVSVVKTFISYHSFQNYSKNRGAAQAAVPPEFPKNCSTVGRGCQCRAPRFVPQKTAGAERTCLGGTLLM